MMSSQRLLGNNMLCGVNNRVLSLGLRNLMTSRALSVHLSINLAGDRRGSVHLGTSHSGRRSTALRVWVDCSRVARLCLGLGDCLPLRMRDDILLISRALALDYAVADVCTARVGGLHVVAGAVLEILRLAGGVAVVGDGHDAVVGIASVLHGGGSAAVVGAHVHADIGGVGVVLVLGPAAAAVRVEVALHHRVHVHRRRRTHGAGALHGG